MTDHEHRWVPLGNLQVCAEPGCNAHRAATTAADDTLAALGDDTRHPMKVDQPCPQCGTADRMYRAPASGYVRCAGCGWVGPEKVNE